MVEPQFLRALFVDTYEAITRAMEGITHGDSMRQPPFYGNCIHWTLGHVVVARCNFLMMLGEPSIWGMDLCRLFIPGSEPISGAGDAVPFDSLVADLGRTQDQLLTALSRVSAEDLCAVKDDKSIGEHLVFYHAHESYHLGQLEPLSQWARKAAGSQREVQ